MNSHVLEKNTKNIHEYVLLKKKRKEKKIYFNYFILF